MSYEIRYRAGRAIGKVTVEYKGGYDSVNLDENCNLTPPGYCVSYVNPLDSVSAVEVGGTAVDVDSKERVVISPDLTVDVNVTSTYVEIFEYEEA